MLPFRAKTIVRDSGNTELARLKKEERRRRKKKEERKTFGPFCQFLVWYLRDVFLRRCGVVGH